MGPEVGRFATAGLSDLLQLDVIVNFTPTLTWLTLDELTDMLHISERRVRRLVAENRIPYTKVGARLRFNLARIQDWLDQNHEPDPSSWRGKPA